jgi:lysophospholipid acyltransferase (LPLAT)-like uncharacterized protein
MLAALYARLVFATCRVRVVTPLPAALKKSPVILALWHQHIFAVPVLAAPNPCPLMGLMSASRDGQFTKAVARRFGIGAAVGSSSRRSVVAVRELLRLAKSGHSLFLTPDGPRGPAYSPKEGATALAKITGLPLIPCALVAASPKITFRKSWDHFWLPLPFATLTLAYGPVLGPSTTPAQLAAALNALLVKPTHTPYKH